MAENPIDSFILEKLNDAQLQPAKRATSDQLTNRLYLDMLEVLPASDPLLSLTDDDSTSSWSQLVDQVLASPYYGERWGRHWLDLARYADSNGFEFDFVRPFAWRYRDYVISAFNTDMPYDQFIKEQLAGDEIVLQAYSPGLPPDSVETGLPLGIKHWTRIGMKNYMMLLPPLRRYFLD